MVYKFKQETLGGRKNLSSKIINSVYLIINLEIFTPKHPATKTDLNMKNHILSFVFMSVLLSLSNSHAQSPTTPPSAGNFYQVRDEILKQMENGKKEGLISEEEKEKDNAMAKFRRWEQFMLPRVGPTGAFFDADAVYHAYNNYSTNRTLNKSRSSNQWQAIGPFSDPGNFRQTLKFGMGRMNCIAQHPLDNNILYVGTMGGGIWKTYDAGATWICLDENLPSMSISDIAINPVHPDTIYAATGDAIGNYSGTSDDHQGHYACGIIMSGDGGTTWTQTGFNYQQMQKQNIYRLVIDPVRTNNLMVGGDKGLYRSTDAGFTWTELDNSTIYDIQINPLDASKYYAITDFGRKLKRSYDGGATFTVANSVNFAGGALLSRVRVAAADTSKIYVLRGSGLLLRSTNAGISFQAVVNVGGEKFGHQWNYDKAIALSPVDTNVILIGLVPLIKSMNKGAAFAVIDSMNSFINGIHVDFHELEFSLFNTNTLYAVNDGGIYVSHDIGETWTSLNNGMNVTQYYKLSSSFLNPDLLMGGAQDNGPQLFDGQNWFVLLEADGMSCSFDKADENIAYASSQDGYVYRSNDGGISFPKLISPGGFQGAWVTPYLANPLNSRKLFIADDKIYASFNTGNTWQIISQVLDANFKIISLAQSPADTATLYAASYRNIFVTHDHGLTWSNITAGLPASFAFMTDVETSVYDANTVYVTFSGFRSGEKVYQTVDGGLTWTNISGTLPNVPFNTIVIQDNGNSDMYAGCDFGVFFKNDTMPDWVAFNSNLPGVIVSDLDINYRIGKLFAATHGRGIYAIDLITNVAPIPLDAAVTKITSPEPRDYCDNLTTPLAVKIKNFGTDTLYNATIHYAVDNGALQSIAWAGNLAPYQSVIDTVATLTLDGGNHHIEAYTSDPNSTTDAYPLNDARSSAISVGTAIAAFPFDEGFETGTFPPSDWFQSGVIWQQDTAVGAYSSSTHSAFANFYNAPSGTDYLSAMRIDLANVTETPFLVFSHAYAMYDANFMDTLMIIASDDCGESLDTLYMKSGQDLTTVSNFVTTPFVPAADEWVTTYIDLSAYMGQLLKIRFEAHAGYSNILYIDDINISQGPVGVVEISENNITVFPNPTQGMFSIADPDQVVQHIQVYDSTGKLLYNSSTKQVHEPIDMSAYQQNMYYIKMQTVKGMVTKKVVVVE